MDLEQETSQNMMLIIDDSPLIHTVMTEIFRRSYEIINAYNGREGLEALVRYSHNICAILLDIVMPKMDGIEVLRTISRQGLLQQIPVFIITSEHNTQVLQEAYTLGAMDVIGKPFVPYIVERRVKSIIELFQARHTLKMNVEQQQETIRKQAEALAQLNVGLIESLATAIEFRSDESGSHVRRIRHITLELLKKTKMGEGLNEKEIELIGVAAITHDVGKIAIPDSILNKPGRLTTEEMEIMKSHTSKGAELLSSIQQLRNNEMYPYAYDIAMHHHERWDGNGYPHGLKGDEISIWSQVVSIADVYDALVSKRCYKSPFTFDQAVEMIVSGQCGAFSPLLLRCFLEIEDGLRATYHVPKEMMDADDYC